MATRSFPALGFDPAPGDVSTIQHLADAFKAGAGSVDQAHDAVAGLNITGIWNGRGAQQAQSAISSLVGGISNRGTTLTNAGKVLDQWAGELTTYQSKAADLEAQAEKAQQKLTTAESSADLKLAGQHFDTEAEAQAAQQRYKTAVSDKNTAQQGVDSLKQQAKQLNAQHSTTAQAHAAALTGKSTGGSTPTTPTTTADSTDGQKTVAAAEKQLGVMYAWGGGDLNGPHKPAPGTENTDSSGDAAAHHDDDVDGFDCSGLVRYAVYQSTGKDVGHNTFTQIDNFKNAGDTISTDAGQLQPGDIVYLENGNHVAVYQGNGNVIEAPESGEQVKVSPLSSKGPIYYAARPK